MSAPAGRHRYSYREYLALEAESNVKHEYLDGDIYAMGGGTPEHAALAVAVSSALVTKLRGGSCRVFSSDLRVRVVTTGLATYPDVSVVCGPLERDPESSLAVTNPRLVVEVTSDSTESYDRGQKLAHYQKIPSLDGVLLVSHRERRLDLWWRDAGGGFTQRTAHPGETVALDSLGITVSVDEIYGDLLSLA